MTMKFFCYALHFDGETNNLMLRHSHGGSPDYAISDTRRLNFFLEINVAIMRR